MRYLRTMTIDDVAERLRAMFAAMPGLRLTHTQLQRRSGVSAGFCQVALDSLVDSTILCVGEDGRYALCTGGPVSHEQNGDGRSQPSVLR